MAGNEVEVVVSSRPQRALRGALREIIAFRGTVLAFAERDLRVKYKQVALGFTWAVLQPAASMIVFAIAFGRVADVSGRGVPYAAFALSALVPWIYLQTAVTFGANALLSDAGLMRRLYFPREVPVLGAILAATVDLAIGFGLFFMLGATVGANPSPTWLLAPFLAVPLIFLAAGVALALGSLNVYYRDFRYALPFLLQLWLFASPVAYPVASVPHRWRPLYMALNPAAGILDNFRHALALGTAPELTTVLISVVSSGFVLLFGYRVFKQLEPNFADVV